MYSFLEDLFLSFSPSRTLMGFYFKSLLLFLLMHFFPFFWSSCGHMSVPLYEIWCDASLHIFLHFFFYYHYNYTKSKTTCVHVYFTFPPKGKFPFKKWRFSWQQGANGGFRAVVYEQRIPTHKNVIQRLTSMKKGSTKVSQQYTLST